MAPPDAPDRAGPYRIEGELGRGGMGVVHRAFDERLHREVALKALPAELASDPEQLARLTREARALALVSHANVAAIHGMEEAEGATCLVLELVTGETLRERLDRGRLAHHEALFPCAQVAAGLAAVHAKGLVHRDLEPSNVMVTPDGVAKLLDFGRARQSREAARGEAGKSALVRLTRRRQPGRWRARSHPPAQFSRIAATRETGPTDFPTSPHLHPKPRGNQARRRGSSTFES